MFTSSTILAAGTATMPTDTIFANATMLCIFGMVLGTLTLDFAFGNPLLGRLVRALSR